MLKRGIQLSWQILETKKIPPSLERVKPLLSSDEMRFSFPISRSILSQIVVVFFFTLVFFAAKLSTSQLSLFHRHHQLLSLPPSDNKPVTGLVVTLDGTMFLVESVSGKIIWSFSTGSPIYHTHQVPMISDKENVSGLIECGDDWELILHDKRIGKTKLAQSIADYVAVTPTVTEDGALILGSKRTTIFEVDATTGKIIRQYAAADLNNVSTGWSGDGKSVTTFDDTAKRSSSAFLLKIFRTDYFLQCVGPKSGMVMWTMAVAEFKAVLRCRNNDNPSSGASLNAEWQYASGRGFDFAMPYTCNDKILKEVYRQRKNFLLETAHPERLFEDLQENDKPPMASSHLILPSQPNIDRFFRRPDGTLPARMLNYFPSLPPNVGFCDNNDDEALAPEPSMEMSAPRFDLGKVIKWSTTLALVVIMVFSFCFIIFRQYQVKRRDQNIASINSKRLSSKKKRTRKSGKNLITVDKQDTHLSSTVSVDKQDNHLSSTVSVDKQNNHLSSTVSVDKQDTQLSSTVSVDKQDTQLSSTVSVDKQDTQLSSTVSVDKQDTQLSSTVSVDKQDNHLSSTKEDVVTNKVDGRSIGKLFVSNKEIAKGSNGTIVLEGKYDGREVAVKRLVKAHNDAADKEIQNLILSDLNPYIVRWYGVEYDDDFAYLALERCTCSLDDLIQTYSNISENPMFGKDQASKISLKAQIQTGKDNIYLWEKNGYPSPLLLKLMREIVLGLAHLHDLGIIHRDLKPQNVLITKEKPLCAKLSDMGISKTLPQDMSSLGQSTTGCGSSGWQAPEQLVHGRQTRAIDLFCLGCVIFFCMTGGRHPFGDRLERDVNIVNNKKNLFSLVSIPEAEDLISCLLDPDPGLRPTASEVLHHPLFWNSEKRISFLRDASDRVELEDREVDSDLWKALESIAPVTIGARWYEKLDPLFIKNIGRYRRYRYDSVRDLLRVMRNKLNHYGEMPQEMKELVGPLPEGFDNYFASRFPRLLIGVYKVMHKYCEEENCFQRYFRSTD